MMQHSNYNLQQLSFEILKRDTHSIHCITASFNTNNMKFNVNKFELLRYGKEQEIKSATTYKSYDDSNIDKKEQVRDIGIIMRE